jgi:hypothetical protein
VPILVTANAAPLVTNTVRAVAATNTMMRLIVNPSSIFVCDRLGKEVDASGMRRNTHADQDPFLPLHLRDIEDSRLHHWLPASPGAHVRRRAVRSFCPLLGDTVLRSRVLAHPAKRRIFGVAWRCLALLGVASS